MAMNHEYAESEPSRAAVDAIEGPVLLEFGAPWCGHCRAVQPLLADVLTDFPAVRHLKIEDAPGQRLGRSFHVKLWPTLIFIRHGKEVSRQVRPADKRAIHSAIGQLLE